MSQLILITASRKATPEMRTKLVELVLWVSDRDARIIVGEAPGGDEQVRRACERLGMAPEVWGAYGKIRQPEINHALEQRHTIAGGYLARDLVMAQRCSRGFAIMLAPRTAGTWATGRYVEATGKRMRWALWDDVSKTWSYYDWAEDIPRQTFV